MSPTMLVSGALLIGGSLFMLLAAVGVLRLPDFYTRLSATSKAATLGAACVLLAGAAHFGEMAIAIRALATIAFLFLTAPVAAHTIARAAHSSGVPLWEGSRVDELAERRRPPTPLEQAGRPPMTGPRT